MISELGLITACITKMKVPLGTNSQEMTESVFENGTNLFSSFFSSESRNEWKALEVKAAVRDVASFCKQAPRLQKWVVTLVTLGHHFLRHVWIFKARHKLKYMFWKSAHLLPYPYIFSCSISGHCLSATEWGWVSRHPHWTCSVQLSSKTNQAGC